MARRKLTFLILALFVSLLILLPMERVSAGSESPDQPWIIGSIQDFLGQPVKGVTISLLSDITPNALASETTQSDGRFVIQVPESIPDQITLVLNRSHYLQTEINLNDNELITIKSGNSIALPTIIMEREITTAFWVAGLVFILVLVLIATGLLQNTLAAFAGASLLLAISYLGRPINERLYIFSFSQAIT